MDETRFRRKPADSVAKIGESTLLEYSKGIAARMQGGNSYFFTPPGSPLWIRKFPRIPLRIFLW